MGANVTVQRRFNGPEREKPPKIDMVFCLVVSAFFIFAKILSYCKKNGWVGGLFAESNISLLKVIILSGFQ